MPDALIPWGIRAVGICAVLVGALSVMSPQGSIRLYQGIMRWFNWRVEPIDLKHELVMTRLLGAVGLLLGVAILVVSWQ